MSKWIFLLAATLSAQNLRLLPVATGFNLPVDIQFPDDGTGRMFVVEQSGLVRVVKDGVVSPIVFLNITGRVKSGGEQGLLGLAFPPEYGARQHFYVNYTNQAGETVVSRFSLTSSPELADTHSEEQVLTIAQPAANHNGGQIRFGPDGYLYIGMGDGGGGNDQYRNGQNRQSLLGKMLRIDVEGGQKPYGIPATNPFVNVAATRGEIWALGLRNPWRFSFDRKTGDLWIGDVGQDRWEEIDFQPASSKGGENYGWPVMEGMACLSGNTCDATGLTPPVFAYPHSQGDVAVTGGFAFRGAGRGLSQGQYVFADYSSGRIWAVGPAAPGGVGSSVPLRGAGFPISTFGEDTLGDFFVADYRGTIYRMDFTAAVDGAAFEKTLTAGSAATVFAYGLRSRAGLAVAPSAPLPRILEGVEVLVNGAAAPLYAVTDRQVNFQAPWELAGRDVATVTVRRDGQLVTELTANVKAASPQVFTYGGTNEAIVIHAANNTLVDAEHPAAAGEFLTFYATGLGAVEEGMVTGGAAPRDRAVWTISHPVVRIGGLACEVTFSGLMPGFVGAYQVNIRVPGGVPAGVQTLDVALGSTSVPVTVRMR